MTESPAAVLRATAALIRERAQNATRGPWEFTVQRGLGGPCGDVLVPFRPDDPSDTAQTGLTRLAVLGTQDARDSEYIASMHPPVALAIAGALEQAGEVYDFCKARGYPEPRGDLYLAALEICRVYNRDGAAR